MSFWPVKIGSGKGEYVHSGAAAPTRDVYGVTITASGTINTKGAWVELDASTAFNVAMIQVSISNTYVSGTDTSMLVDIGIGGAGSEQVIIPNLLAGSQAAYTQGSRYQFPIRVPAGTRIAARCQSVVASDTAEVAVVLSELSPIEPGSEVIAFGVDTSLSAGTLVTSGTGGSEGAWTEITASTSAPIRWIAAGVQVGGAVAGNVDSWADLAVGASGSEQEILTDFVVTRDSSAENLDWMSMGFPVNIPASTRLSVRRMASGAGSRDYALYGVS